MTISDLRTSLNKLIIDLSPIDQEARERLELLGEGLWSENGEQQQLVHLDLNAVVSPASVEEMAYFYYQQSPGWLSWFEFARNVLILLPIAITWHALSAATANYSRLIDAQPELITQPFLLLWEQGFGGRANWIDPTFSLVAAFDFTVLCLIVLLTTFVHFQRDVRDGQAAEKARLIRRRVEQVLWQINRQLAPERFRQAQVQAVIKVAEIADGFQLHTKDLLNHLSRERERLEEISLQRERDLSQLTNFSSGLIEGTERILTYGRSVDEHTRMFQRVLDQLNASVSRLEISQTQIVDALGSVEGNTEVLRQATTAVTRDFDSALDGLRATTLENTSSLQTMAVGVNGIRETGALMGQMGSLLRQALGEAQGAGQAMLADLGRISQQVATTAGRTADVSAQMAELGSYLHRSQEQNNELIALVSQMVLQQGTLAEQTGKAVNRLDAAITPLGDLVGSLKQERSMVRGSQPQRPIGKVNWALALVGLGAVIIAAVVLGSLAVALLQRVM